MIKKNNDNASIQDFTKLNIVLGTILEAFQNALLLELDDNTRKKTQSLLEATKKREKRLKDFWH